MWAYQFATMQFTAEKHGWTKFISMQNQHSLLYREEEREMNKFCIETGVGLIPVSGCLCRVVNICLMLLQWSPLAQGKLARPFHETGNTIRSSNVSALPEADKKIIGRVEEVAKNKGWKMSQVALAWSIKKGISSPIIGFSKIERMDEALAIQGKELDDEDIKYLEEPYAPKQVSGF